ncbi:TIGR03767 family metallophosphoesterase [Streptomyces sp. NPDC003077]|uniref:TIGR03767 family metallophosphoesterase n=1 Tax=Streptomyces sp. NPDC003077 TaxID=3154443 RepID=UPI0033B91A3A
MPAFSRRTFVTGASGAALGLALADGRFASAASLDRALARTAARAVRTAGTTLEQVATPTGSGTYKRLRGGPGWPLVVRGELAPASATRDDRRTGLASFVQLTDLHLVDTESPVRFEYLSRLMGSGAHRPQETLSVLGTTSLIERVNSLSRGPFTGTPFSLVMTTGDNTDNHEHLELDWYLTVMSGGTITPSSGDPNRYEGVQNSGSTLYWNPEAALRDAYKARGFPRIPGFLTGAGRKVTSPGLRFPWYTTVGNHDDSIEGTLPDLGLLRSLYTGDRKIEGCDDATADKLAGLLRTDPARAVAQFAKLLGDGGAVRRVTPDERREPFTPKEFARAHLSPVHTGSGPVGHGYTEENAATGKLYYTFQLAEGVVGVSLDTTNRAGFAEGSIGTEQLKWLEDVLRSHSDHWYETDGRAVRGGGSAQLVVLFSHHTSTSMDNLLPDPYRPFEARHDGKALVKLLQRYPNVVAWVNGHSHENRITAHGHAVPERSFWEINTASHVDYPQHARIIEIADNGDGTLSLFTTLVESAARYETDFGDTSEAGLAALYRELSFNDPHSTPATRIGTPADHNTELLLHKPRG